MPVLEPESTVVRKALMEGAFHTSRGRPLDKMAKTEHLSDMEKWERVDEEEWDEDAEVTEAGSCGDFTVLERALACILSEMVGRQKAE